VADARVIPIGGERPRRTQARRSTPRRTPSAADAVAAGASRASGERARRRQASPLIDPTAEPAPSPSPRAGTSGDAAPDETPGEQPRAHSPVHSTGQSADQLTGHSIEPDQDQQDVQVAPDRVAPDKVTDAALTAPRRHQPADLERKVAGALAFVRRRITGEAEVDDFGFDPELTDHVLLALMRPLYERYFRVEVRGLDNVPSEGGALVVANHSGTIPLDSVMTQIALRDRHPAHRYLRLLGADLVFQTPFVGEIARKTGTTLACNADAERLLSRGELVGVWPEGFKGIGKPFSERYKLQRFGRGGFVSAALRSQVPIVPCSIVGAEEIYPIIGNMKTLARLLGLPYVPVTPTFPLLGPLGLIPLPSKWIIEFGKPIDTLEHGAAAADDPMLVFNLTDQVRETIQHTLYRLLMSRRSVFF
jgi:1-acyl-sn-glycerol-3-phosphate acyltransferase